MELTEDDLDDSFIYVHDINQLLPQLAPAATPVTPEWLTEMLKSGTRLFVALDRDKVVGTVLLCTTLLLVGRKDWIEDVIVDRDYRGNGIASKLMDMAEEASRWQGAKSLNLTSKPERLAARKMYENRGYVLRKTGVFQLKFQ